MRASDEHGKALIATINDLYATFADYQIPSLSHLSCFDFGPSSVELADIRDHPLREIPPRTLRSMEFFAYGWESWGSESEVKHFLPRLLEFTSEDIDLFSSPGLAGLFKYKLCGALRSRRRAPPDGVSWPAKERDSLAFWAEAVLVFHLHVSKDVLGLVEAVLEMGMLPADIINIWSGVDAELRGAQVDPNWTPTYADDPVVRSHALDVSHWMGMVDLG